MCHKSALGLLTILALSTVFAPCQSSGENSAGTVLSHAALLKRLETICNEVNAFYKAEHFPVPAPSPEACSFSYDNDDYYKSKIGKFDATNASNLDAKVVATSGTIITFFNWDANQAAYGPAAPLFTKRPPAHWTKEHAIEVATKFAEIFIKPWGVKLGRPTADFDWPFGSPPKASMGEWTVRWRRESLSGIPFLSDTVNVGMSEEYGPDSIGIGFTAEYDDVPITPIAQSRALNEARKGLANILAWAPAKNRLPPDAQIQKNPHIQLLIVEPNDLLAPHKSLDEAAFSYHFKARLAWVVTYGVSDPTDPSDIAAVTVFIDAKDGSFLGGTF